MTDQQAGQSELAVRVEALEKANRRYRCVGGAALVAILGIVSLGQASPGGPTKEIRTQSIDLVDGEGKPRISLGFYADGSPMLEMRRRDQSRAVTIFVDKDGSPAIGCMDKDGKPRITLGVMRDGWAIVGVSDGDGAPRVTLNAGPSGEGSVRIHDTGKTLRAVLGAVSIADRDADRTRTTSLGTLTLFDKTGSITYQVPR